MIPRMKAFPWWTSTPTRGGFGCVLFVVVGLAIWVAVAVAGTVRRSVLMDIEVNEEQ